MRENSRKWLDSPVKALLPFLVLLLLVLFVVFVAVLLCEGSAQWITDLLDRGSKGNALEFIGIAMGGVILAIQATVANRRAKAMEETANAQVEANKKTEQGQQQERLKNAIEHLGHDASSVRLGGAYELFHLAEEIEGLRRYIFEILCAHIRQTSGTSEYQDNHGRKPSTEIQSLLTLLFVQEHGVFQGLDINLQGSWLSGASLNNARLPKADLLNTNLQGADLRQAQLQSASLRYAQLRGSGFREARLQGADLFRAQLQKADLRDAQLQGSGFREAQLQEANLSHAQLQKADLRTAQLQDANLHGARLQGAALVGAQLLGANLTKAWLQGADLLHAQLQCAGLREAQLQGASLLYARLQAADLRDAQLQGIHCSTTFSSTDHSSADFVTLVRQGVEKESDFSFVYFSGGVVEETWLSHRKEITNPQLLDSLRAQLEPHFDKPASFAFPEDSGAKKGSYTQEDADHWIEEYKEAIRSIPE